MSAVITDFKEYFSANKEVEIKMYPGTPYTVQFEVYCEPYEKWILVDLLPIVNIFGTVFFFGQRQRLDKIYSIMKQEDRLRKYYAKCLAKFQVAFVKEIPPRVKDLIRLMKYWKYSEHVNVLNSYCIELLVIYVWRTNGSPNNFTMKTLMKGVVQLLASFSSVAISFDDNYDPKYFIDLLNRHPPYVLDPANPFHIVSPKYGWLEINLATLQSSQSCVGHIVTYIGPNSLYEVELKGRLLIREYDKLPEGNEESNISAFKVTAGILTVVLGLSVGAFLFVKYSAHAG